MTYLMFFFFNSNYSFYNSKYLFTIFWFTCSFPSQPFSPVRILVYDNTNERVNPRLRQFIQDSPPHIQGEWHLPSSTQESGLTNEEFKKAMKKVRKQVYNPPYPRKKAWKRSLFNNKTSSNTTNNNSGDEEKDEGKTTCVICLESFEPNEQVLVTPCNHMFHHDCFVPWLKSQGKCPICRFSLCEGKDMALALSSNNSSAVNNDLNDLAADLAALIRAMEEAFNWVNLRRSVWLIYLVLICSLCTYEYLQKYQLYLCIFLFFPTFVR